jgi:hypothetical protein
MKPQQSEAMPGAGLFRLSVVWLRLLTRHQAHHIECMLTLFAAIRPFSVLDGHVQSLGWTARRPEASSRILASRLAQA